MDFLDRRAGTRVSLAEYGIGANERDDREHVVQDITV
jgi:hypothetical protein